mmetsp:Transcript_16084/g.56013  ORF Transcript_16084/g.56013 Transcript_16084/m.56013 type:complete len:522 (+) Transcript_16084:98-1663(+)
MEPPDLSRGLLLDLRARSYDLSGSWTNLAASGPTTPAAAAAASGLPRVAAARPPEAARVPSGVRFDEDEKAFFFSEGGDVISTPLATNPWALRSVTYSAWVKVPTEPKNLAWLLCQSPDYGWSRALTLNDYRLGHVSIATSRYWDSGLGKVPVGEWCHVVGVWCCDAECNVYLNGVRGEGTTANNGKSADSGETLFIGGRSPKDTAHNAANYVSDVAIWGRALSEAEVQVLYRCGRPSGPGFFSDCLAGGERPGEEDFDFDRAVSVCSATGGGSTAGNRTEQLLRSPQRVPNSPSCPASPARELPPIWEEATGLFWCSTGLSAYDIPDGDEWQQTFREAVKSSQVTVQRRSLQRNTSDTPTPGAEPSTASRPRRTLARHPSDPDQRAVRAAHTEALIRMTSRPGTQARVQGRLMAFFRFGGAIFATDARCPHQGASLCEGEIGDIEDMVLGKRYYVRCKVHKFQFDLTTGNVLEGHCPPLRTYSARIRHSVGESGGLAEVEVGFNDLGEAYFCPDDSGEDF